MNTYKQSKHVLLCFQSSAISVMPLAADLTRIREIVTKNQIIAVVESVTGFTIEQMKSASRKRPLVYARYCLMCFIRNRTGLSLNKIGDMLGRDHSTVIYGLDIADSLIKYDQNFKETYRKIERLL
jgi:chromosomal replication initiation ATPase DnaA